MAITRLQQARQMYAMGQRVGGIMGSNGGSMLVTPTRDGSRPGYSDTGPGGNPGDVGAGHTGDSIGGGNGGEVDTGDLGTEKANVQANLDAVASLGMTSKDRHISNMYTNMPTPTITIGETPRGPITVKTTYKAKRAREQLLDALNAKGISSFDPRVTRTFNFLDPNNLMTSFAPNKSKFGLIDLGLMLASGGLFGSKIATGAKMFNRGKFALDQIQNLSALAETLGITNTNVAKDFVENVTGSLTSKGKTTSKTNDNKTTRDGDGVGSTPEMAALRDEYYLLLQKLQTGNIVDAERNRLTALKNLLRI